MKNLFGEETRTEIQGGKTRKTNPLLGVFGQTPGAICKDCRHFVRKQYAKVYYKCGLIVDSGGPGTDWKANWPACGKFEAEDPENFEAWHSQPIPERAGSILDRYYQLGYLGRPYKGKKGNRIWSAYKAGRERRKLNIDRYGNRGPVQIETGEWWFNGCFIQDQRSMKTQGLSPFVIFPDRPKKLLLETEGNVQTAWSFKEAVKIALDWGMVFTSEGSARDFLG